MNLKNVKKKKKNAQKSLVQVQDGIVRMIFKMKIFTIKI